MPIKPPHSGHLAIRFVLSMCRGPCSLIFAALARLLRKQKRALHVAELLPVRPLTPCSAFGGRLVRLTKYCSEGGPGLCARPLHLVISSCRGNADQIAALRAFDDPVSFVQVSWAIQLDFCRAGFVYCIEQPSPIAYGADNAYGVRFHGRFPPVLIQYGFVLFDLTDVLMITCPEHCCIHINYIECFNFVSQMYTYRQL